jgi:hypothetical protein
LIGDPSANMNNALASNNAAWQEVALMIQPL